MRVGVLTGGGDCPGLNAVIRAVVRKGVKVHGFEFVGYRDGWRGPLEGVTMELGVARGAAASCRAAAPSSARAAPTRSRSTAASSGSRTTWPATASTRWSRSAARTRSGVATKLADLGVNVVGVPKTIDNDLSGTDFTFGFDTAVNIATEAIDRLHTTAESHHRVLVVEVMGRHAGWIALHAGIAGGANIVLIPEQPFDIEEVCRLVESRFESRFAPIMVVAEGAVPQRGRRHDARRPGRRTPSATSGSAASATGSPGRSRPAPARRRAPSSSATSSAAARPPPSTAGSPPASACRPSTPSPTATSAR